ncbi:MAG: hypothetical protein ACR2NT_05050 [Acidimicrobiia bacterium]
MESKRLTAEVKSTDPKGVVEATVATLSVVDHDGDIVEPGALGGRQRAPLSAYNHSSSGEALPVGVAEVVESGSKWLATTRYFLETLAGREAFATLKALHEAGLPSEYSWGYAVITSAPDTVDGRRVRRLKALRLLEVSPVLQAASVGTGSTAVKCDSCLAAAVGKGGPCPDELAELRQIRDRVDLQEIKNRFEIRSVIIQARKHLERPYSEVSPDLVPATVRSAAVVACGAAAADLNIPQPAIRWFQPGSKADAAFVDRRDLNGMSVAGSGEIWLRSSMGTREAAETAAHETAHLSGANEDRATMFGIRHVLERSVA